MKTCNEAITYARLMSTSSLALSVTLRSSEYIIFTYTDIITPLHMAERQLTVTT